MTGFSLVVTLFLGLLAASPAAADPPGLTYCVQASTVGGVTTPRVCLPVS